MLKNAEEITRLHARIKETVAKRHESDEAWQEWKDACAEFHANYDRLAFPNGLNNAEQQILEGDAWTIDAALDFLECRPYFFRSGYIRTWLIRRLKKAPMRPKQKERFDAFLEKEKAYKERKKAEKKRP